MARADADYLAAHKLKRVAEATNSASGVGDDPVPAPVLQVRRDTGLGRTQDRLVQEDDIQSEGHDCTGHSILGVLSKW